MSNWEKMDEPDRNALCYDADSVPFGYATRSDDLRGEGSVISLALIQSTPLPL